MYRFFCGSLVGLYLMATSLRDLHIALTFTCYEELTLTRCIYLPYSFCSFRVIRHLFHVLPIDVAGDNVFQCCFTGLCTRILRTTFSVFKRDHLHIQLKAGYRPISARMLAILTGAFRGVMVNVLFALLFPVCGQRFSAP